MSSELLKEKVVNLLRANIVANIFKPGQPLNERELSENFKTSKTPVREAIQILYKEGFVQVIPQKGCFVSQVDPKDVREIFLIREAIEGIACREAAARCDHDQLGLFEKNFKSMKFNNDRHYQASKEAGKKFHQFLTESTGNRRLIEISTNALFHLERISSIYAYQYPLSVLAQINAEHLEILQAIKGGNGKQAESLMRRHVRNWLKNLKAIIW